MSEANETVSGRTTEAGDQMYTLSSVATWRASLWIVSFMGSTEYGPHFC